jgi:hypothetical protein
MCWGIRGRKAFSIFTCAWLAASIFCSANVGAKNPPRGHRPAAPATPAVDVETVLPASEWTKPEAFDLATAGAAAASQGSWAACVEKDRASVAIEDQAHTRLHLATCESKIGQYLAALADALKALKISGDRGDEPSVAGAREHIAEFLRHVAHVSFVLPAQVNDLELTFDGKPVPLENASKRFSVDPGSHTVHAEATVNGQAVSFDRTYDAGDGENVTAAILLVPRKSEFLSSTQLQCILGARNQATVFKCLPESGTNLVERAGFEVGVYSENDHVQVFAPMVSASISSPTQGWNVAGSYLVDVVSAASPDIVSEASPPFHEVRNAGSLSGGYKPGLYGFQASGHVSSEPDYLSLGAGLALTADLNDKLITPRLEYAYTHDTIGRGGTPFSVFHHTLQVHEFDAGLTFVLSARSLLLLNAGLELERGDQSKPYRYVPIFDPAVAPFVPRGASVALVNNVRLPVRPLEQLPLSRDRYSLSMRFAHRFNSSTLRLEERLYRDSWEQMATTTDLQYLVNLGSNVVVWPHLHFNAQTAADFYRLTYTADVPTSSGIVVVPAFRTTDRELSPLVTGVAGAGARVSLSPPMASTQYSISLQTDVMYTRYLNALYLTSRVAIYGTLGFDAEFQ